MKDRNVLWYFGHIAVGSDTNYCCYIRKSIMKGNVTDKRQYLFIWSDHISWNRPNMTKLKVYLKYEQLHDTAFKSNPTYTDMAIIWWTVKKETLYLDLFTSQHAADLCICNEGGNKIIIMTCLMCS